MNYIRPNSFMNLLPSTWPTSNANWFFSFSIKTVTYVRPSSMQPSQAELNHSYYGPRRPPKRRKRRYAVSVASMSLKNGQNEMNWKLFSFRAPAIGEWVFKMQMRQEESSPSAFRIDFRVDHPARRAERKHQLVRCPARLIQLRGIRSAWWAFCFDCINQGPNWAR